MFIKVPGILNSLLPKKLVRLIDAKCSHCGCQATCEESEMYFDPRNDYAGYWMKKCPTRGCKGSLQSAPMNLVGNM